MENYADFFESVQKMTEASRNTFREIVEKLYDINPSLFKCRTPKPNFFRKVVFEEQSVVVPYSQDEFEQCLDNVYMFNIPSKIIGDKEELNKWCDNMVEALKSFNNQ